MKPIISTNHPMVRIEPAVGQLSLLVAPSAISAILSEMIAELSFKSQVMILDGGNRFDGYSLARALRRRTADLQAGLQKVLLSRVFTCYQMLTLLGELPQHEEPIILLDLLSTFLDESVRLEIRQGLLSSCLVHLQRLSQSAPVVVWARKRSIPGVEDAVLLEPVLEVCQKVWHFENAKPGESQLALF